MGARPTELTIPKPAKMPKVPFLTEAELAKLVKVSPGTIRAWRRRGETPAPSTGPEAAAFAESRRRSGSPPTVYRCSDISAWLFGKAADGRPPELPASAWDAENDRTMQLRRAGQAAKNAGEPVVEKRIRRQLTSGAKFAARLGFPSPSAYEDWIARGSPEDELPAAVQVAREAALDPDAPLVDDESSERLQRRTDAVIANLRGVSPGIVTAERRRAEPAPPLQPRLAPRTIEISQAQAVEPTHDLGKPSSAPLNRWAPIDDDPLFDPFATGRSTPRRSPGGYFRG